MIDYKKQLNEAHNLLFIWLTVFLLVASVMYIGIWHLREENRSLKKEVKSLKKQVNKLENGPIIYSF